MSHSKNHRDNSRRNFLKNLGASAALTPFLPIFNASGQEALSPRRIILFFTPHATYFPAWVPSGTQTNFTLGPILSPLQQHIAKINILRGVVMPEPPYLIAHTPGGAELWTGSRMNPGNSTIAGDHNTSASVDQVIAQRLAGTTPFPSLQFRMAGDQTVIYGGPGQEIFGESSPKAAFTRLFSQAAGQLSTQRTSVLNLVNSQVKSLQAKLSTADKLKLDAHLSSVRNLELQIGSQAKACGGPSVVYAPSGIVEPARFPYDFTNFIDIATSALTCDLTRVVSIQFGQQDNDNDWPYSFLGQKTGHHSLTHLAPSNTVNEDRVAVSDPSKSVNGQLTAIYKWYAQNFAYLLSALDAVPEGSGTLLDHTLVIWGTELADYGTHGFGPSLPLVVAGGGAYGVKTGRNLDFTAKPQFHNRLLVSAAQYMGLSDITKFGNLDTGSGPLVGF